MRPPKFAPRFPPRPPRDPRPNRFLLLSMIAAAALLPKPPFGSGSGPTSGIGALMIPTALRFRDRIREKTASLGPVTIPRPPAHLTRSTNA
ncbi:hypothetical protein B0T21DRAFT_410001 [Apiosordaria backusii]|uniref:Uncharacterized protein n=1 Tax=Apiosordaria backusii TaxID=314023 RepID=A0AA40BSN0_9PEZI|nr:hypothetical protein B0T21DRAFT_410001 [Apiosordaria backusii]